MSNIIVKTIITTTEGDLLHESTQLVRTDPVVAPPVHPQWVTSPPTWTPSFTLGTDVNTSGFVPVGATTGTAVLPGTMRLYTSGEMAASDVNLPQQTEVPAKRKPGRPRTKPLPDPTIPKRKPGRPRKVATTEG